MKAIVDPEICTGCGLCVETCPEVFEMNGGVAEAKPEPVQKENEKDCRQAAEECPVNAISIEN